ncbi:hypothetical protein [Tumebacillus flagellatus]|uniref:hypothetical protein n=1 Tax=Tumebacillus flagellatus TaxID=1157490 RepID=UPI0012693683|nr:hypothetical protein [Tumebacillus flagellatus]
MKVSKRFGFACSLFATLSFLASAATASPGLCYYSFGNGQWGSGGFTNSIDSPIFIVTNSSKVCTINGWQDTGTSTSPANVEYRLYQYGILSNTLYGSTRISGNYPQSGSWYSYTYTGVDPNQKYFLRMYPHSSAGMSGAGNAYDGY